MKHIANLAHRGLLEPCICLLTVYAVNNLLAQLLMRKAQGVSSLVANNPVEF